ncbi:MAG TPA: peptidase MA family metallohydrolase [Candidatus Limnocylindrales bacterium]|nr:peptidase MA family metallohydrolase [Candidatus Limnocylindrales bacterium]
MTKARLLAALAATTMVALGIAPSASAASQVDFAAITATSTFGQGIDVTEMAMLPDLVHRTEALIRIADDDTTQASDATVTRQSGWSVLDYHLAISPGDVIPNTVVHLQFRVTLTDGTVELGPETDVRYEDTRFDWQVLSGQIIRVHWAQGDQAFGQRAVAIGDKAIADASALLGVTETQPVDFFVYPDETSFRDVLGPATREHVGGVAFPDIRTLFADIPPDQLNDPWVGIVVPHELTHLVFGTATKNPYHSPPHWLNEGLAVYLSQGFGSSDQDAVHQAASAGTLMPLPSLNGQFPTEADRFGLAYSESVSAIDFLIRTYGKPALVQLIRTYAQGLTDDETFKAALGVDVAGFEAAWLKDLGAAEPTPFGPQPAPAGNVPADWGGAAASPGAVAATPGAEAPAPLPTILDLAAIAVGTAIVTLVVIGLIAVIVTRRRRSAGPG